MSELREAARKALYAMERANNVRLDEIGISLIDLTVIDRLRAALAQPEATAADLRVYDAMAANYAHPPRDAWRPASEPPTESTIAAKCQRIERSGEICGLTPPCPDCGSSLIDVPEGSL